MSRQVTMRFQSLIEALALVLEQEKALLRTLSAEAYRRPSPGVFRSSIGQHIRHNLDHFEAFFTGLDRGRVDYECRGRDPGLSEDPNFAAEAIDRYLDALRELGSAEDRPLEVREESEAGADRPLWLPSSLGRELQFLLGHTVHHHALIAMMAGVRALSLPEGFGVAPSTQRHERCAAASPG